MPLRDFVLAPGLVLGLALAVSAPASAQPFSAQQIGDVVRLEDARSGMAVSIAPGVGNIGVALTVNDEPVVWWPYASPAEFAARPSLGGIPFMGPWANRLDEQAFYANGRRYAFDMGLGNVRGEIPIHGFLATAEWQLVDASADTTSAWATSRLEFYKEPAWISQFPFAHTIEMTYRLRDGMLEVATRLHNLSTEPMPVAIGFHPYFQLTDSRRDDWTISVGARTRWLLDDRKLPTGETEPIDRLFPDPQAVPLRDHELDEVFADLVRDADGRAVMTVKGRQQQVDVIFGRNWRAAVVWAPKPASPGQDRNFVCFEPMAGISNALNLAERGVYSELQSISPDGVWEESFWVRPTGF
ncbi:MAG: aldose 1-epimerase [Vicinamibacterales bacterium]|jgi:aldose 1-epimerase|nr:aldose 1-epimerase [Vicinamibacterales bacterium]MDP7671868.1 aldose 1-epimerase [Vicinamibacterales bacterium]HJO37709.1 aldose 1-epimerase [Vicinamibacterales bacterium]